MKRIESIEDQMRGVVTYELAGGDRFTISERDVREYGAANILRARGVTIETARVPVHLNGKVIGTVGGDFDPPNVKSTSAFYEVRGGDFKRQDTHWEAAKTLCPGDFEAIPDFIWSRPKSASEE